MTARTNRRRPTGRRDRGFTLIELMVAVAIVGILAAIAYPSYMDAVRKGKRGQAKGALVELAQRAERWRTVHGSFDGFWASVDTAHRTSPRQGEGTTAYNLAYTPNETGTGFTLSAVPQGSQVADTRCMTLTLDHAGRKGVAGGATGTVADCW
ncbi:type IV pilin protein [Luteimonas sp. SDU82]|uniref:type IV pilin protein n=1 Tax=Luteimonas sp. SDU82 TaxID=3422592 RepID=UPI003EBF1CFF